MSLLRAINLKCGVRSCGRMSPIVDALSLSSSREESAACPRLRRNYRPGARVLTITDEIDKNRFGRELPLSDEARKAPDSVCPAAGVIFGKHDYRTPLRAAAKAAGIEAHRADRATPYDFRHSRLTHLGQVSSNLSGIMSLAGHRQPSTTAKYMRPHRRRGTPAG